MIDISIVIPTYNGEQRLPLLFQRLACQSKLENIDWQILVIDNGSTDNTAELIKQYQASWSLCQLLYYYEPNRGTAYARQLGIEMARGSLVGFLDDDNLPYDDWVRCAYEFGISYPNIGAYGSRIYGKFEVEPDSSLHAILFYLGINDRGSYPVLYHPRKKGMPPGAGLVVRRIAWINSVPKRLFLEGRTTNLMLASEDSEMLLHIYRKNWEIWYNPLMVVEHYIPSTRLELSYLVKMVCGIGLTRFYLRMLLFPKWQIPFLFIIYLFADVWKLILFVAMNWNRLRRRERSAIVKVSYLASTMVSPFFIMWLKLNYDKS